MRRSGQSSRDVVRERFRGRRWGLVLASALVVLPVAACAPPVALPPATASPEVVLDAYLRALVAGDCDTERRLVTATFVKSNGELCSVTRVSAYRIEPSSAASSSNEVVFATVLTTTGSDDGTIRPGEVAWFYSLDRQPDGSWRLDGGGSGP